MITSRIIHYNTRLALYFESFNPLLFFTKTKYFAYPTPEK